MRSVEYITRALELVRSNTAPSRDLDLMIERIFNTSLVHDDHLDRYPESAQKYTSSVDACRKLVVNQLGSSKLLVVMDFMTSRFCAGIDNSTPSFNTKNRTAHHSLETALLELVLEHKLSAK